jgi:aspartate racemase
LPNFIEFILLFWQMTFLDHPLTQQVAIPGILGGLGPLAHIEFEQRLLAESQKRGARCDQDHPMWLLVNATAIPDRTRSLSGDAEDCTPWLVRYGKLLEAAGVNFLIVPCNTAHAFYDRVQPQLHIPWIHLMTCTARHIVASHPTAQRIGVMATDGTLKTGLYSKSLAHAGLTPIMPALDSQIQQLTMQVIYHPSWGIKASGDQITPQALNALEQISSWYAAQGADLLIAGCTELSVGFARTQALALPWVDPLVAAAQITLDLAFGHRHIHSFAA